MVFKAMSPDEFTSRVSADQEKRTGADGGPSPITERAMVVQRLPKITQLVRHRIGIQNQVLACSSSQEHTCDFSSPSPSSTSGQLPNFKGSHKTCNQGSTVQQQLIPASPLNLCPRSPFSHFPVG